MLVGLLIGGCLTVSAQAGTVKTKEPKVPWTLPADLGEFFPLPRLALDLRDIELAELARVIAEENAVRFAFFSAVLVNDQASVSRFLQDGMDPNVVLPTPTPPEFRKKVTDELLAYYVIKETGVTALMVASTLGYNDLVKTLLAAGADPWRVTGRDKTFALWLAGKKQNVEIMQMLMGIKETDDAAKLRISVDLVTQQATLLRDGKVEFVTPISSGRKGHVTPPGRFVVTNKYKLWKSTIYPAKMPNFLRLSCEDFGLHAGNLPGYPASHGCIRLPAESAQKLFASVPIGTVVEIR